MAGADRRVSALTLTEQSACSAGLSRDLAPGSIQLGLVLREVSSFKVPSASQTAEYRSKIRPLLSRHDLILKYVNKGPPLACREGKPVCREPLDAEWLSIVKAFLE